MIRFLVFVVRCLSRYLIVCRLSCQPLFLRIFLRIIVNEFACTLEASAIAVVVFNHGPLNLLIAAYANDGQLVVAHFLVSSFSFSFLSPILHSSSTIASKFSKDFTKSFYDYFPQNYGTENAISNYHAKRIGIGFYREGVAPTMRASRLD